MMDWHRLLDYPMLETYGWRLLDGLRTTALLVGFSFVLGFVLAYPIAGLRLSNRAPLRAVARAYIAWFRGTPLLCQLYLVYYGAGEIRPALTSVGLWWFFRDAFNCCLFAFTLNTAAYQAEIVRGALLAVPRTQREAAASLGLSRWRTFRHVVWPQALLVALRPYGNELISMIKASALAAIVTLLDLMGQTRFIFARSFDFTVYLYAALIYLALTGLIARLWTLAERRLARHLAPAPAAPPEPLAEPATPTPARAGLVEAR